MLKKTDFRMCISINNYGYIYILVHNFADFAFQIFLLCIPFMSILLKLPVVLFNMLPYYVVTSERRLS